MVLIGESSGELIALFAVLLAALVVVMTVLATTLGVYSHYQSERAYFKSIANADRALRLRRLVETADENPVKAVELRDELNKALLDADESVLHLEETPVSVLTKHPGRGSYTGWVLGELDAQRRKARAILSRGASPEPPENRTLRW
jgi:hypothetical protein